MIRTGIKRIVLTILMVAAFLIILANLYGGFTNIHDRMNGYQSSTNDAGYFWDVSDGRYMRLLGRRLEDQALDHEVEAEYLPYQAVADYYYAAVIHKAYKHAGYEAEASLWQARMEEALAGMEGESSYADEINALLEQQ